MVTFDTHRAVQKLRGAGFSQPQADATVEVVSDAQRSLMTQADGHLLEARINAHLWRALLIQGGIQVALIIAAFAAIIALTN